MQADLEGHECVWQKYEAEVVWIVSAVRSPLMWNSQPTNLPGEFLLAAYRNGREIERRPLKKKSPYFGIKEFVALALTLHECHRVNVTLIRLYLLCSSPSGRESQAMSIHSIVGTAPLLRNMFF